MEPFAWRRPHYFAHIGRKSHWFTDTLREGKTVPNFKNSSRRREGRKAGRKALPNSLMRPVIRHTRIVDQRRSCARDFRKFYFNLARNPEPSDPFVRKFKNAPGHPSSKCRNGQASRILDARSKGAGGRMLRAANPRTLSAIGVPLRASPRRNSAKRCARISGPITTKGAIKKKYPAPCSRKGAN